MIRDNKRRLSIVTKIPKIRSRIVGQSAGFIDRLKKLSKRDIALICAGLGILILAPVAEHFMMRPSADRLLTPGFGSRKGIGATSELYEPGAGGFAPGMAGTEGDVITPLSARDPSSLIIAPEGFVKPPATSSMGLKDAVRGAAKAAVSRAVRSAGAPAPLPKLKASLRGLGMARGGTSTSGALASKGILQQADGAPSKAAKRSSLGPVAMADYRGVSHRTRSADGGAFDQLKAKAGSAASHMNKPGAADALDRTAGESVEVGAGTGGGGPGEGEGFTKPSDSSIKGHHGQAGETLAQKLARMRAENAIEDARKKRNFWEIEMPQMVVKSIFTNIVEAGFFTPLGEKVKKILFPGSAAPLWVCWTWKKGTTLCKDENDVWIRDVYYSSYDRDEIMGFVDAVPTKCPCSFSAVSALPSGEEDSPGGGDGGGGDGGGSTTPPTQAAIEVVIDSMNTLFVNFDENVAKVKKILEGGGDAKAIKKAYDELLEDGALVSADEIIKQVDLGINVVENSMKPLPPAIVELKGLLEKKRTPLNDTWGEVTALARKRIQAGRYYEKLMQRKDLTKTQKYNLENSYNRLMGAKDLNEFAALVVETKGEAMVHAPASIIWNYDRATRKMGGAQLGFTQELGRIKNVEALNGSLDKGLEDAKLSRDYLVQQISDAKALLQKVPKTTVNLGRVYWILMGEELEISLPAAETTTVADADLKDAPIDPYKGFRPGVKELLGKKEQVDPEKNFSNAYINNPESGVQKPKGYFSLLRMTVRIDVIKENLPLIESGITDNLGGFINLAKVHIKLAKGVHTSLMGGTIPGGHVTQLAEVKKEGAELAGSLPAMLSWPADIAPGNIFATDYAKYISAGKDVRRIRGKMEQNNRELQAATDPDEAEKIVAEMKRQEEAYTDAVNQCSQAVSSAKKRKKEKKKFKTCNNDTPLKAGLKCMHGFVYQRGKCRTKVRSGCKEYYWKPVEVRPE